MGWVGRADLAAAVSSAGGLGCIGVGSNMEADDLRSEIYRVRAQTTQPFGVEILFAPTAPKVNDSVRCTDKAVADGADVLIASGPDGAARVGSLRLAALAPDIIDVVNVPVLVGGGLADGRGRLGVRGARCMDGSALITGGASGMGEASVRRGVRVILADTVVPSR
jgi:enoyl-[acyl-carrier protein] reductase II